MLRTIYSQVYPDVNDDVPKQYLDVIGPICAVGVKWSRLNFSSKAILNDNKNVSAFVLYKQKSTTICSKW